MVEARGVSSAGWRGQSSEQWAGLTGLRYLLAVALLVALATVPMLVAVMAGAAALHRPLPPAGEVSPFVTDAGPAAAECRGWPERAE